MVTTLNTTGYPFLDADGFFVPSVGIGAWVPEGGNGVFGIVVRVGSPVTIADILPLTTGAFTTLARTSHHRLA